MASKKKKTKDTKTIAARDECVLPTPLPTALHLRERRLDAWDVRTDPVLRPTCRS